MSKDTKSTLSGVTFPLKAYSVKQLSELYGVSAKTFRRWLSPFKKDVGEKQGNFFNISQVKCIVSHLGVPGSVVVE